MRVSALVISLALLAAGGCSARYGSKPAGPSPAGIAATLAPAGVDDATWSQLTGKLASELAHQASSFNNNPHLPPDAVCAVDDLTLTVLPGEGYEFEWTYRNPGDFDQNGEVNAGDLTPIGRYLGSTPSRADWQQAQVADGDGNGAVNLADISVIASHWKNAVNGYVICPEFGDSDNNGEINISDLTPLGAFVLSEINRSFIDCFAHPDGQTNAWLTYGGFEPWGETEAGSPGLPGPWLPGGILPLSRITTFDLSGRRLARAVFKPSQYARLTGFTVGVAPALDVGLLIGDRIDLSDSRLGSLSPIVTLPGF